MKIQVSKPGLLILFIFDDDRLEVFSFKYLTAIQTFDVIDSITACQDNRTFVLARGLHNEQNS
jgi:hypothetical protein